ncbi:MAG: LacI family DNA-binding transcriptional regulator [Anaerolineae bacterium]|nr:LacI family DNA-binding transcriptional regulator [Anaerolineae bacterium]
MAAARKKRVTIKQVAEEADVSIQTVSRVLNDMPHVAPDTRDRVHQVIERLQYRPSALARSLINQRSMMLGVITAGLTYIGPSHTLDGIASKAEAMGYSVLLNELPRFNTFDFRETKAILHGMLARQVDGVIWAVPEVGNNRNWVLEQLPNFHVPFVFLTMNPQPGLPVVAVDNRTGTRLAVEHLLQQGFRRIGHLAGPLVWWEARERKAAWAETLQAAGLPVEERMWAEGNWSSRSGEPAAGRLLDQYPEMDAIFVANDQMALSMLSVARTRGLALPRDLAVVGFDGIPESAYFSPPLTTVFQDLHQLGCRAVQQLITMLEDSPESDEFEPATVWLEPELIVRESSIRLAS